MTTQNKLSPELAAALTVHELAKDRAEHTRERQRRSMHAHAVDIVRDMQDAERLIREKLFLLKTILESGSADDVDVDPEAICATFIELAAIAFTLPAFGRGGDAAFIGKRCLLCDATIVGVEHPRGRGELSVLVCSNGHRAMQPADGEDDEV